MKAKRLLSVILLAAMLVAFVPGLVSQPASASASVPQINSLIPYGDFETATNAVVYGGLNDGVPPSTAMNTWMGRNYGTRTTAEVVEVDGNKVLKMSAANGETGRTGLFFRTQATGYGLKLPKGYTYQFSADVFVPAAVNKVIMMNAAASGQDGPTGGAYGHVSTEIDKNGTWQHLTQTFTVTGAGETGALTDVWLRIHAEGALGGLTSTEYVYIDNISLVAVESANTVSLVSLEVSGNQATATFSKPVKVNDPTKVWMRNGPENGTDQRSIAAVDSFNDGVWTNLYGGGSPSTKIRFTFNGGDIPDTHGLTIVEYGYSSGSKIGDGFVAAFDNGEAKGVVGVNGELLIGNYTNGISTAGDFTPYDFLWAQPFFSMDDGLPDYTGGSYGGSVTGEDGSVTRVIHNTTAADLENWFGQLTADGWTLYSENTIDTDSIFATYTKDNERLYGYYIDSRSTAYIITEDLGVLPGLSGDNNYTAICDPLLTQVQLINDGAHEGMGYIIRLADGRFVMIDGGYQEADQAQADALYAVLEEQKETADITIAAWFLTHPHSDHISAATDFIEKYADTVTIEQVIYNFPDAAVVLAAETGGRTNTHMERLETVLAAEPGIEVIKCHTGEVFYYADATFEILFTLEDFFPKQITDVASELIVNTSSVIFSMEIGGQKTLFTGDSSPVESDAVADTWGSYLNSDIMQLPHHGEGGSTVSLMEAVDPSYVLIPQSVRMLNHDWFLTTPGTDWVLNNVSGNIKGIWIHGLEECVLTLPYPGANAEFNVVLPTGDGYTLTAEAGSVSPVADGGSFSFKLTLDETGGYVAPKLTVKVNGATITPDGDGVYTIDNIGKDPLIEVSGVYIPQEPKNLLHNGSFNVSDTSYWWFRNDWTGGVTAYSADGGVDGTGAITITGTANNASAGFTYNHQDNWNRQEEFLVLKSDEEYTMSFKVKLPSAGVALSMVVSDKDWRPVDTISITATAENAGQWVTVESAAPFGGTGDATIIVIRATNLPEGQVVYIDDITLLSESGNHQPDFIDPNEPVVPGTPGGNLLRNAAFELTDMSYWWFRPDWGGGTVERSANAGKDGSAGLVFTSNGQTAADGKSAGLTYNSPENQGVQEHYLELIEGETYTLSFDVKRTSANSVATMGIANSTWGWVSFNNISYETNAGTTTQFLRGTEVGTWETVTGQFVAPAGGVIIRMAVEDGANGEKTYFDNISLTSNTGAQQPDFTEENPGPTEPTGPSKNLLRNGSFNSTDISYWWFRPDWGGGTMSYSWTGGVDGTGAMVATGNGAGGDTSAGMTYNSPANQGVQEQYLQLIEGETYTLSFDVLRNSNAVVEMTLHSADWTPVVFNNVSNAADGGTALQASKTGQWETISGKFTAPAGEVIIRFAAINLANGEKVYIDNISLVSDSGAQQPDFTEEDTTLGYNIIIGGDAEGDTSYWWVRKDWNGGIFEVKNGVGVNGSKAFVATGVGAGTEDQNAGMYYVPPSYQGVQEEFLKLEAGKEYHLQASFYIPDGVSSAAKLFMDINNGALGTITSTVQGEWETLVLRFIAPEEPIILRVVANGLPEGQQVFVDNIELREVGGDPNGENPYTEVGFSPWMLILITIVMLSVIGTAIYLKKQRAFH